LAVDRSGGLLVADDLGDTVWRVSSNNPHSASNN
jgi:glucose/arabinose dehydrogenase